MHFEQQQKIVSLLWSIDLCSVGCCNTATFISLLNFFDDYFFVHIRKNNKKKNRRKARTCLNVAVAIEKLPQKLDAPTE